MLSEHGSRKWSFDAAHTWAASRKESGIARTVVLKLKPANSRFSLAATPQVLHLLLAGS